MYALVLYVCIIKFNQFGERKSKSMISFYRIFKMHLRKYFIFIKNMVLIHRLCRMTVSILYIVKTHYSKESIKSINMTFQIIHTCVLLCMDIMVLFFFKPYTF